MLDQGEGNVDGDNDWMMISTYPWWWWRTKNDLQRGVETGRKVCLKISRADVTTMYFDFPMLKDECDLR